MLKVLMMILLFLNTSTYGLFGKDKKFVVVVEHANVYENFIDNKIVGRLDLGTALKSIAVKGVRVQFLFEDKKVWVNQNDLLPLDITAKQFSESSILYADSPVHNSEMWFVFKDRLYQMDLKDPRNPHITFQSEVPKFSQWELSPNRMTALLIGNNKQKGELSQNMAFYRITDREFIPLTFIYNNLATINTTVFSPDSRYLALYMTLEPHNYIQIYDSETGAMVFQKDVILGFTWFYNDLIVYTDRGVELYPYKKNKWGEPVVLHRFNRPVSVAPENLIQNNQYYIEIDSKVYTLEEGELVATEYRTLNRSLSGEIQSYEGRNEEIITTYKGRRLRNFSGTNPHWSLLSILNDKTILYRYQEGPIQNVSLYDIDSDESSDYVWVENPQHTLSDGTSIESVIDGDEVILLIENPNRWIKSLKLNDILK